MKIGLDVMGGDFAPAEAVKGVLELLNAPDLVDVQLTLFGDEAQIKEHLNGHQLPANYRIVHTEESIGMAEHPTKAISQKRQSTISLGLKMLAEGELDAFTGAGNTGAMMVGALYTVKAIDGVLRPSLTTLVPKIDGSTGLMLDVGANADVKPDVLVQFAVLGSLYAQHVLGIASPKVGLLSIGEEKEKGNLLNQAVYPVLEEKRNINFIGNIEGRDLFSDKADVIVCDGFTGNIVLKTCEGFFYKLKKRGLKDDFLDRFNFEQYGGTAILGVNKPVIIGHGISKANTFVNMIRLAKQVVLSNLIPKIKSSL
ncbi:MAG: phosphate acyltransferase PlsX [Flavobacteriales bacterium]|nr:phosphate acyltransferase PlsX [Bacteroidota bacterium]MCB9240686.1 phosphate acyltransferase PlsX [Flavobacteriales bacterium]